MVSKVSQRPPKIPVRQFSIFTDNRVGRLHSLIESMAAHDIHIMALSQLDTAECNVVRCIVDYHENARDLLNECGYSFVETEVVAIEIESESKLSFATAALVEAEINIHYLYPFLSRPKGKSGIALHLEDNELAESVLRSHNIVVLDQNDIAR